MTIRQRNSLYVDTFGPDEDAAGRGFHWLCQTAASHETLSGIIAVCVLGNLKRGVIRDVLGEEIARSLAKDKRVTLTYTTTDAETEIELSLLFLRQRSSRFISGPLLAFYPDKAMTVSLPLSVDEVVKGWIDTWQAQILGSPPAEVSLPAFYDRVVENALKDLTCSVNLSTGIGHPQDERAAIATFKLLHNEGYVLDSTAIRGWLIRHKWASGDADDVCALVQKIVQNKRVGSRAVGNTEAYHKNTLDLWKTWDDDKK